LGEDFNGRIGERGAKRNKKLRGGTGGWEKKIQIQGGESGGKRVMEWIEENGCKVLNGNKQGDEEGEWTYIDSRGETLIDYGIVNEES
jgi:hypothetical protein